MTQPNATSPWGPSDFGISYFRHGEMTLLLETNDSAVLQPIGTADPPGPLDWPGMSDPVREKLRLWLTEDLDIELYEPHGDEGFMDPSEVPVLPFLNANHQPRELVPIGQQEQGDTVTALYTVNLREWIPRPVESANLGRLVRSIISVPRAVTQVNNALGPKGHRFYESSDEGRIIWYSVAKASTNWLGAGGNS